MEHTNQISCGCCRGAEGHRCTCWIHQDTPRGNPPQTCSRHQDHATTAQPYRGTQWMPYDDQAVR